MDFDYTPSELMATAGARELRDREVVAVGLGLPVVASFLAKQTHAPHMTILFELGVIDPEPVHCGVGLADPRVWYRAKVLSSFVDILGALLHKGLVDVGFLGGLETDQYGNLNTTLVGDPRARFRHMIGSGGANDIASCAQRTIIIIRHEARKLKQAISFVTSPGYITGGDSRAQAGLRGGPSRVITDKAIFGFHPETKHMMLTSIHPGNTLDDVLGTMGFAPLVPQHVPFTEPPTPDQVHLIREVIDPQRMYMG
jgi:glutaconate CoA-transferase, subunit B